MKVIIKMKICKSCGEEKKQDEFIYHYISKGKPATRKSNRCHACDKKWRTEYHKSKSGKLAKELYHLKNPDKIKKWKADDYQRRKDKYKMASKSWYQKNKETAVLNAKKWYDKHPNAKKEQSKKYRNELNEGYLIDRLKSEFGFTYEEIKDNPELIEFKRLQLQIKRATGLRGIRNKKPKNDTTGNR